MRAEIALAPNGAESSDALPDDRVVIQGVEIGLGWGPSIGELGQRRCEPQPCCTRIRSAPQS
jgi:uncharacterized protein (DUF736 family)